MQGPQLSKNVMSVVGRLCVSRSFREDFFEDPRAIAQAFAGTMTEPELAQIDDLAGDGQLPTGVTRESFRLAAAKAFDNVYSFYMCPMRPCPRGD
jgi:hypothetical protein